MNWLSYQDFFSMGGYGLYVWGSFAVFFAVLVLEVSNVFIRNRAALKLHCAQQKISPQRALEKNQAFKKVVAETAEKSRAPLVQYNVLSENHTIELR